MFTKDDWLAKGYTEYETNSKDHFGADMGFQKAFADGQGMRFFITVFGFDNEKKPEYAASVKNGTAPKYTFFSVVQNSLKNNTELYNFEIHGFSDISEMENNCEKIWIVLGCNYYQT